MTLASIKHISDLIDTMQHLRSEQGCSWDREQTPESLRPYILEEAYELVDAIDSGETDEILSELGDLLLQVVFLSQIFSERKLFEIGDVAEGINQKLLRRHPQIFNRDPTTKNHPDWEQIKQGELAQKGKSTAFADRLPQNLPSLKMAYKIAGHLNKSGHFFAAETRDNPGKTPLPENLDEETLARSIFNLVAQGQQAGIDSDIALRNFLKKLLSNKCQERSES